MIAVLRFWKAGLLGAILLVLALMWASKAATERQNARLKQQLADAGQTIVRIEEQVRARSEHARAVDLAKAAQAERQQQKISREIANDYQTRLGDLRSRYDALRLRAAEAGTDQGRGREQDLSGPPAAASGVDGAAGKDGLPTADALIASEQALRLKSLQDWVRAQGSVER